MLLREGSGQHVVVVGSLNYDLVVPVKAYPAPGETVLGGDHFRAPGGKGANQAVAAARLGQRVAMVGRVGPDAEGKWLIDNLRAEGIDTQSIAVQADSPTGVAFIQVSDAGDNSIVVSPGANWRLNVEDIYAAAPWISNAAVVLLQLEVPLEAVEAAAMLATGTVILNPAPARPLPNSVLEHVDVLVPNQSELAALVGSSAPGTVDEVIRLAARLPRGAEVVVTMGADGAVLVRSDGTALHVPGLPVPVVDTTAAGDCFCGGLADALARGEPLEQAVEWAVRCSSLAVTRLGAQPSLPTRSECLAGFDS